jgi:hypothetical protein
LIKKFPGFGGYIIGFELTLMRFLINALRLFTNFHDLSYLCNPSEATIYRQLIVCIMEANTDGLSEEEIRQLCH